MKVEMTVQEIKDKWLKELRFGNHIQVQDTLCGENSSGEVGFCCLGVLHKHVLGKGVRVEKYESVYEGLRSHYESLINVIPAFIFDQGVSMNDGGYTFLEIADMIELGVGGMERLQ